MALSSWSSGLLRRLLRSSAPTSSSSSSILRATFCSSSGPSPTSPPPSSIFGDDTEVANVPPLTTPKLFVSGLSRLTTDEKLKGAFDPFGRVLKAKVVTERISGRSKGFGFVRYATIEEAEKARQEMNAKFLDGWVIFVDPAKPRQPKPSPQQDTHSSHTGFTTNKTLGMVWLVALAIVLYCIVTWIRILSGISDFFYFEKKNEHGPLEMQF